MTQLPVTKVHGSRNEILVIDGTPDDHAPAERLVRRLCDRGEGLGADGVYFVADAGDGSGRAWFFNPDGSESLLCGNGMRGAGRLLLDRYQADQVVLHTGPYTFTVRDAGRTPHGVRQTAVELPPVDFTPDDALIADVPAPVVDRRVEAYHPTLAVTAVAVPNSHLVSVIGAYDEADLIATGRRVAETPEVFPLGANVSFILALGDAVDEVYVQTYERGAGLTPSCGSGNVASRAVLSRLGRVAPDRPVLMRNPGGVARCWMQESEGRWQPVLEGNATIVYRARVNVDGDGPVTFEAETDDAEIAAFEGLHAENRKLLAAAGVNPSV